MLHSAIGMKRHTGVPCTGGLRSLPIQIDNNWVLSVPHNDSFANLILACIDFLVGNLRWNVNKVARARFLTKFQLIAPTHSNSALDHVENGLQFSMVMRPGLGIRLHQHRTGPQFVCSSARMGDCGSARHARCLWRIQI